MVFTLVKVAAPMLTMVFLLLGMARLMTASTIGSSRILGRTPGATKVILSLLENRLRQKECAAFFPLRPIPLLMIKERETRIGQGAVMHCLYC